MEKKLIKQITTLKYGDMIMFTYNNRGKSAEIVARVLFIAIIPIPNEFYYEVWTSLESSEWLEWRGETIYFIKGQQYAFYSKNITNLKCL